MYLWLVHFVNAPGEAPAHSLASRAFVVSLAWVLDTGDMKGR